MLQNFLSTTLKNVVTFIVTLLCAIAFIMTFTLAYLCLFLWQDLKVLYEDIREML